ncbi:D-alanyl-D-alanine carboxypeptidase [hydrothermal vent metagenome]|uniref:D-alanyl-D-alanine carboxypeptidase n=1 Tax=hydrothermal vent metagenome TaxID=652676 RepID=A0A1W1EFD9_9ZZZZ
MYITEVGKNGRELASLNASTARTPASVIKVLSTYAAVAKLGFNYRWPTQFYKKGKVKNGILYGDLIVKGFGDPSLSYKDLPGIVAKIKAKGIKQVRGNIVIDRTYFSVGTRNNSHFDSHTYSPYNAMPDAMMFNERISTICVAPNRNKVYKKHVDGSYRIKNNLTRVNKPCRGRYSWPGAKVDNSSGVPTVILQGKISKNCGTQNISKVITKPYKSFYYAFKEALNKGGVKVNGKMRLNKVPKNSKILFTHYSASLEKIVSKTAKKSNNLYARHLLLYLGAKMYGAPANLTKGRRAVEQILRSKGALGPGILKIDNGSGLSRTAKLNAKLLAYMFDNAYSRYGSRWMRTLSIAGVDGTIKRRFRGSVAQNRAWMKTGTLNRVKNIGGYVKSRSGRIYTVVIIVNTTKGRWKAAKLQNDIIKWLVTYKGRGTKKVTYTEKKTTKVNKNNLSFYIQTGSFVSKPSKEYFNNINSLGLKYRIKTTDKYKVLIGPFNDEMKARSSLAKVRENITPGAFIVNNQ